MKQMKSKTSTINELIQVGKVGESIDLLIKGYQNTGKEGEVRLLSFRFNECVKNQMLGLVSMEDYNVQVNNIVLTILEYSKGIDAHKILLFDEISGYNEKISIIVDESNDQNKWIGNPTSEHEFKVAYDSIYESSNVYVNKSEPLSSELLKKFDVLIFPPQFRRTIEKDVYQGISDWVFSGGNILTFGFYLMEEHHNFNYNELIEKLEIEFHKNLIVPVENMDFQYCLHQSFAYTDERFFVDITPKGNKDNHPILKGVNKLRLISSCSVGYHRNYELLVATSEEMNIMKARGLKEEGRIRRIDDYYKDKSGYPNFLIASKHGNGKVVGVGTWKLFLNNFMKDKDLDNQQLFKNIINWLSEK